MAKLSKKGQKTDDQVSAEVVEARLSRPVVDCPDFAERDQTCLFDRLLECEDDSSFRNVAKEWLERDRSELKRFFETGGDAPSVLRLHSDRMDLLIAALMDIGHHRHFGSGNPTTGESLTVLAVGGYGRAELAPQSDIDLLFLHPYKRTPYTEQMCEFLLYKLWDLGLKVGQSTRNVNECIKLAQSDLTIRTTLLETRLLWGSSELFDELESRFRKQVTQGKGPEFIVAKLAERDARHVKTGDSRFLLEPNIKEGKGGLRDLHTLIWLCRFLYQFDQLKELVQLGVITSHDLRRFQRSRLFLWTVRCHLHYISGRAEERLTFDLQPKVAAAMGYRDRRNVMAVERFMKRYYLVARDVGSLTRIICAALEDQYQRKTRFSLSAFGLGKRRVDGFTLHSGRISIDDPGRFLAEPISALRLFAIAQERDLDIHPQAMTALTPALPKIAKHLRNDAEANALFLDMLEGKSPAQTLSRMNEVGLLGRFLPPFGRIVGQMQHNLYHSYTVDEHTIRAIGVLSQIEAGTVKDELPLASDLIRKILGRRELFVALLLHDVGKGRVREHSEVGAEIALSLCPRLGLSPDETETVAWLVLHHLHMSGYAFKRDPEDLKTITDFAGIVDSLERLRLLLILTVADIRAVGPNIWNGWKGQLLRGLYNETAAAIATGDPTRAAGTRITAAQSALAQALRAEDPLWSEKDIETYIMRHDRRYWLSFDAAEQLDHARAITSADSDKSPLTIRYRVDEFRARTELFLFAGDHPGLFMKLAGAISLTGLSIVDARILTTLDGMALDVIGLQNAETMEAVTDNGRLERLTANITKALGGTIWLDKALTAKNKGAGRMDVFEVEPKIRIDNQASRSHSVIEINGRDRPGLLFDVCRTLLDLGLVLNSAHIATYGERVVDVFYVKDVFGLKITQDGKRRRIEKRLKAAIGGTQVSDKKPAPAD